MLGLNGDRSQVASMEKSNSNVHQIVEQILKSGKISRREYQRLSTAVLADNHIDEDECRLVNRVFDAIRAGRLKVID